MIQLLPGNNGRVLLACLRKRPWWHATSRGNAPDTDNEDLTAFIWEMYRNPLRYKDRRHRDVLLNHLQNNSCLVSKKGLYLSLQLYSGSNQEVNLLDIVPRTYYLESGELVTEGQRSRNLADFITFNGRGLPEQENRSDSCGSGKSTRNDIFWIVKPAARTNRGFGIQVVRGLEEVLNIVNRSANGNKSKSD